MLLCADRRGDSQKENSGAERCRVVRGEGWVMLCSFE